jgi:hypothetical protein
MIQTLVESDFVVRMFPSVAAKNVFFVLLELP